MATKVTKNKRVNMPDRSLYQAFQKFSQDSKILSEQKPALMKNHPDKWVAFYNGKLVAVASNLDTLIGEIRHRGLKENEIATEYLGTEKHTLIL